MNKICSTEGCESIAFEDTTKCVLHCEKKDYPDDAYIHRILESFYDALVEYIADSAFKLKDSANSKIVNSGSVKTYLRGDTACDEVVNFCKNEIIVFSYIFFPCRNDKDFYDYLKILRKIKGAHFNYCKFTAHSIEIPEVEVFFEDCEFIQWWSITQCNLLENDSSVLYQCCKFRDDVSSYVNYNNSASLDISLFNNCSFDKELSFRNISLNTPIFNNTGNTVEIHQLKIENCKIENKFVLNNLKTKHLSIKNSEFKEKLELKDGLIEEIELINNNFNGLFDSYSTKYGKFYCFQNIFSDFVGFEKCKFADLKGGSELNQVSVFKYVTFLSFTNFRNTTFCQGLDLQDTNLKEAPNFLNINLKSNNTNRETLRIIKNSFDKIGNHIEANKFFVLEMKKYKQELSVKPLNQERLIFWLNEKASNFGQSYFLPILWIIAFSGIYYLLILGHESNLLYNLVPSANKAIGSVSDMFNGAASNILTFKKLLREGMEFVSLLFYVIFASLSWQTIVAVKRHTRR